jgi:hypothetical protein
LLTDGFVEARDAEGAQFGDSALAEAGTSFFGCLGFGLDSRRSPDEMFEGADGPLEE